MKGEGKRQRGGVKERTRKGKEMKGKGKGSEERK